MCKAIPKVSNTVRCPRCKNIITVNIKKAELVGVSSKKEDKEE